jgi:immunoglobulin-binding protein 1
MHRMDNSDIRLEVKSYEQLVKDGMEDDEKLVEASAKLDREWDDWKEENPRGSGNKMSERGDRNF